MESEALKKTRGKIDVLTGLVASLDEEDTEPVREITGIIESLKNTPDIPGNLLAIIETSEGIIKQIENEEIEFELGYSFLCEEAENLRRSVESLNEVEEEATAEQFAAVDEEKAVA